MINARLADRLAVSLKDRVRSAHFQVKRRARPAAKGAKLTPVFSQQVAMAADVVIDHFGSTAAKFFPNRFDKPQNIVFPNTISAYFLQSEGNGWKVTADLYQIIKDLVRRFSNGDCLVYESSVAELYIRMMERHISGPGSVATGEGREIDLCAALAVEFASLRPIKAWILEPDQASAPRHFFIAPNQYVAFVIALSVAVKTREEALGESTLLSGEDILNLVDFAVDARFPDLSGALKSRNAIEHLTGIFSEILPFIG